MSITTNLSCPRGQAKNLTASAAPVTDVSGWNFAFTVRTKEGGTLICQATTGNGITVSDVANGVLVVSLTAAQTLWPHAAYYWDFWRTDAGHEDQLASGTFTITESYRV